MTAGGAPGSPGQVITFYSYKGGTGRSMALANVGCLLARQSGARVLMIDWDLEAPGLHRYFRPWLKNTFPLSGEGETELNSHPGLIDLFLQLAAGTRGGDGSSDVQPEEEARFLVDSLDLRDYVIETDIPFLDLIKAGRFDDQYPSEINTFQWEALDDRSPWLIRSFADRLAEEYSYVLIDSRTGLTDISGICTMLMPDKLVLVFTPNRQSLQGVVELARKATDYRKHSDDLRPLSVFPLPSRVEASIPDLRNIWRITPDNGEVIGFQPPFEQLLKSVYGLPECNLNRYFDEVQIQQIPDYAFGEQIAVMIEEAADRFSLTTSFRSFTDRLVELEGPWEDLAEVRSQKSSTSALSAAAETVYADLARDQRRLASQIFARMVRVAPSDEGGRDDIRWVSQDELNSSAWQIVIQFARAGVLQIEATPNESRTRLVNDSVIEGWDRLRNWINSDRNFLHWRQELGSAIADWKRTDRDESALLFGSLLGEAERYMGDRAADLNSEEIGYIQASQNLESRQERQRSQMKRQRLLNRIFFVGLIIVVGVAAFFLTRGGEGFPIVNSLVPAEVRVGQQVDLLGENLDLVSEVRLVQAPAFSVTLPLVIANESRLTVTILDNVEPGIYSIEFRTLAGDTIITGPPLFVVAPSISINPMSGPAGTLVTVTGSNFPVSTPLTELTIGSVDVQPVPVLSTDATGSWSVLVVVPRLNLGAQTLTVKVGDSTARVSFEVLLSDPTVSPPTATPKQGAVPTRTPELKSQSPIPPSSSKPWQVLRWTDIYDRKIIDPDGKYWEKYARNTSFAGRYFRMDNIDNFGDFLELKPDGTFEWEVGGNVTPGNWRVEGSELVLTLGG